jgi:hypothetical protein
MQRKSTMNVRPLLVVGSAIGVLAAAFDVKKLLEDDDIRNRLGLDKPRRKADGLVDLNSDQSFPASDPPSFSPVQGIA